MRETRISSTPHVAVAMVIVAAAACTLPVARDVAQEGAMNNERLEILIQGLSDETEGQPGYWSLAIRSRQVLVITDANADRMRIMTPVAEDTDLPVELERTLLEANFDRALDARYAIAQGFVWSAFIHPLSQLTEDQFVDGVAQVVTLAENYGTSFTSTNLVFQGGQN